MKFIVQRTGLSPHVLRVWERRYGAVQPQRSDSNRRLYDKQDLGRLELLARLTKAGHGIRQIARLTEAELESMAASLPTEPVPTSQSTRPSPEESLLEQAWSHVAALEPAKLRSLLERAEVTFGATGILDRLVVPLVNRIGNAWQNGEISVAEEHAASAVIKESLFHGSRPYAESSGAPGLVVGTPAGQLHELGAAMVSSTARRLGWNVIYLGPSLPAEEITRAVVRSNALAVALSIVYPADDPQLPDELRRLRRLLPGDTAVLIGGRAAHYYQQVVKEIGATLLTDIASLREELDRLRVERARTRALA